MSSGQQLRCALMKGEGVMTKRETYESMTEELLLPIVEKAGVGIYDVEYVKEGLYRQTGRSGYQ